MTEVHTDQGLIGIGPGIVIGRLQHDGVLEHWQGNNLKQKLELDFRRFS